MGILDVVISLLLELAENMPEPAQQVIQQVIEILQGIGT